MRTPLKAYPGSRFFSAVSPTLFWVMFCLFLLGGFWVEFSARAFNSVWIRFSIYFAFAASALSALFI
jgi:hypothetical protein